MKKKKKSKIEEASAFTEKFDELNEKTLKLMAETGKKSLYYFAHRILGYKKLCKRIHLPICLWLMDFSIKLKGLFYPRGTYKSTIVAIAYPIWYLLNHPNASILLGSYDLAAGQKWLRNIRTIYEKNKLFRALYPEHVNLAAGCWCEDQIIVLTRTDTTVQAPSIRISSPEQIRTGDHYHVIILDDTVERNNSQTEEGRVKIIDFIKLCFSLAFPDSIIILSGTRYHYEDAHGYFKELGPRELNDFLQACHITDAAQIATFDFKEKPVYKPEEYKMGIRINQFPEIWTDSQLLGIEFEQGPFWFAANYMLEPSIGLTQTFHEEWFQEYTDKDLLNENGVRIPLYILALLDPGAGFSDMAAQSALVVLGLTNEGKIYLLDAQSGRWSDDEFIKIIIDTHYIWQPQFFGIEAIGFQRWIKRALDEYTQRLGMGIINIEPMNANRGQETADYTVLGCVHYFSQGRVFIKKEHDEFKKQFTRWKNMKRNDYVRAFSYLPDYFPGEKQVSASQDPAQRIGNYLRKVNVEAI